MFNFSNFKEIAMNNLWRTSIVVKKHSPEILLGVGIAGMVTSTVLACKATLKVDAVKEDGKKKLMRIVDANSKHATEAGEEYTQEDFKRDTAIVYIQSAFTIARLYAPAVAIGVGSIGCIVGGHRILNKRNAALMAAYKLLDSSFRKYQERVIDELGAEKEHNLRFGAVNETQLVDTKAKNGEIVQKEEKVTVYPANPENPYSTWFSEKTSTQWRNNPISNKSFLKGQQLYANDLLRAHGSVFLNEVYDSLGLPRTDTGALCGWVRGYGDDFVDFGIENILNSSITAQGDGNGNLETFNNPIFLNFNVTGPIVDML